jgi:hypothetical protein
VTLVSRIRCNYGEKNRKTGYNKAKGTSISKCSKVTKTNCNKTGEEAKTRCEADVLSMEKESMM